MARKASWMVRRELEDNRKITEALRRIEAKEKCKARPNTSREFTVKMKVKVPFPLAYRIAKAASKCKFDSVEDFLLAGAVVALDSTQDAQFCRNTREAMKARGLIG